MEIKVKWADGTTTAYNEFDTVEACIGRIWGSAGLPTTGVEIITEGEETKSVAKRKSASKE